MRSFQLGIRRTWNFGDWFEQNAETTVEIRCLIITPLNLNAIKLPCLVECQLPSASRKLHFWKHCSLDSVLFTRQKLRNFATCSGRYGFRCFDLWIVNTNSETNIYFFVCWRLIYRWVFQNFLFFTFFHLRRFFKCQRRLSLHKLTKVSWRFLIFRIWNLILPPRRWNIAGCFLFKLESFLRKERCWFLAVLVLAFLIFFLRSNNIRYIELFIIWLVCFDEYRFKWEAAV